MAQDLVTLKVTLNDDTRRFSLAKDQCTLTELVKVLNGLFPNTDLSTTHLTYLDEDGDVIRVTSEMEMKEALNQFQKQGKNVVKFDLVRPGEVKKRRNEVDAQTLREGVAVDTAGSSTASPAANANAPSNAQRGTTPLDMGMDFLSALPEELLRMFGMSNEGSSGLGPRFEVEVQGPCGSAQTMWGPGGAGPWGGINMARPGRGGGPRRFGCGGQFGNRFRNKFRRIASDFNVETLQLIMRAAASVYASGEHEKVMKTMKEMMPNLIAVASELKSMQHQARREREQARLNAQTQTQSQSQSSEGQEQGQSQAQAQAQAQAQHKGVKQRLVDWIRSPTSGSRSRLSSKDETEEQSPSPSAPTLPMLPTKPSLNPPLLVPNSSASIPRSGSAASSASTTSSAASEALKEMNRNHRRRKHAIRSMDEAQQFEYYSGLPLELTLAGIEHLLEDFQVAFLSSDRTVRAAFMSHDGNEIRILFSLSYTMENQPCAAAKDSLRQGIGMRTTSAASNASVESGIDRQNPPRPSELIVRIECRHASKAKNDATGSAFREFYREFLKAFRDLDDIAVVTVGIKPQRSRGASAERTTLVV